MAGVNRRDSAMKLAIFDIDGTLVRGSTERHFWRYLARHGKQGPRQMAAYAASVLRRLAVDGVDALRRNKAYLSGLQVADVEALAAEFVAEVAIGRLFEPAVERLRCHVDRADTVVLLSGTLDGIARALAAHLGVTQVIATVCAQRDGRFVAEPPVVHPFGATKLALARELADDLEIDVRDVNVYANSRHDLSLLTAVGTPVAVQPDTGLRRIAEARGWEIIDDGGAPRRAQQDLR
jgi:HAD superfamily hydrolase (TIGR01490 family)